MLDTDTFLITLYVTVDDFYRSWRKSGQLLSLLGRSAGRGPDALLSPSEVITLAVFGQLSRFQSERGFWRFANARLRHLFPNLPDRTRFNRLQREQEEAVIAFFQQLSHLLDGQICEYEIVDRCGIATRWCNRRGVGWLPEYTDKGKCSRLGWFHGFQLLTVVNPEGVITGFGVGPASAKDQPLGDAVFAARHVQDARCSFVGLPCVTGTYLADAGFIGENWHQHWREQFGIDVVCPPRKCDQKKRYWPPALRRWHAGLRQRIESVHNALLNEFRLARERPHDIRGFFARLSAKVALHNFCIYLNRQLGRDPLEFADLIGW